MATVSGVLNLNLKLDGAPASPYVGPTTAQLVRSIAFSGAGTSGSSNIQHLAEFDITVPAGGNVDTDLSAKYNPDGTAFGPSKVTGIALWAEPGALTAGVSVKGSAANGLAIMTDPSDILPLSPYPDFVLLFRGYAGITFDGTHKSFNVADLGAAGGKLRAIVWGV